MQQMALDEKKIKATSDSQKGGSPKESFLEALRLDLPSTASSSSSLASALASVDPAVPAASSASAVVTDNNSNNGGGLSVSVAPPGVSSSRPLAHVSALDDRFPAPLSPRSIEAERPKYIIVLDGDSRMRVREVPRWTATAVNNGVPAAAAAPHPDLPALLGLAPSARVVLNGRSMSVEALHSEELRSGDVLTVAPVLDWPSVLAPPVPATELEMARLREHLNHLFFASKGPSPPRGGVTPAAP
jgi:hypothetical protein